MHPHPGAKTPSAHSRSCLGRARSAPWCTDVPPLLPSSCSHMRRRCCSARSKGSPSPFHSAPHVSKCAALPRSSPAQHVSRPCRGRVHSISCRPPPPDARPLVRLPETPRQRPARAPLLPRTTPAATGHPHLLSCPHLPHGTQQELQHSPPSQGVFRWLSPTLASPSEAISVLSGQVHRGSVTCASLTHWPPQTSAPERSTMAPRRRLLTGADAVSSARPTQAPSLWFRCETVACGIQAEGPLFGLRAGSGCGHADWEAGQASAIVPEARSSMRP